MTPTTPPKKAQGARRKRDLLLLSAIAAPLAAALLYYFGDAVRFSFRYPWVLLALVFVPLAYYLLIEKRAARLGAIKYSSTTVLGKLRPSLAARLFNLPPILRVLALTLLVLAAARPQTRDRGDRVSVEGIDIMVALDMSQSMEADDLEPNRLQAATKVLDNFIRHRRSDRIGLVVFGKEAFTYCPLTLDYSVLRTMIGELRLGLIDGSATAIGNALGVSLARLKKSDAKSKVIILLTDGESNSGNVMPEEAAKFAQQMGVKVFTILMGPREGQAAARRDIFGRPIPTQYGVNPKLLQEIANSTGGNAYQAEDRRALSQNFQDILNQLDKSTRRDVAAIFTDAYRPFVGLALLLIFLELGLSLTRLRSFP